MHFNPRFLYTKVPSEDFRCEKSDTSSLSHARRDPEMAADIMKRRLTNGFLVITALSLLILSGVLAGFSMNRLRSSHSICPAVLATPPALRTYVPIEGVRPEPVLASTESSSSRPGPAPIYDCGNSSASAVANGCVWNPLSIAWQPSACSTAYTAEYLSYTGGEPGQAFWTDQTGGRELSKADMSGGGVDWYWMTRKQHKAHCAYMLLRFYDAVERGERIDSIAASKKHAKSCLEGMLEEMSEGEGWEDVNTASKVRYIGC